MKRDSLLPILVGVSITVLLGIAGSAVRQPWHDELFTLFLSEQSYSEILTTLAMDNHPPGYYMSCRLVSVLTGHSVFVLRLLSVSAMAATAWLVILTALGFGRRAGWAAVLLFAPHPLVLALACDARGYSFLALCSAGAFFLLLRDLSTKRAICLAAVLAAACWVHSLGLVLTGAVLVASTALAQEERLRAWVAGLAALLLHLPWVPVMIQQPPESLLWAAGAVDQAPVWKRWLLPITQTSPAANQGPWLDLAGIPIWLEIAGLVLWIGLVAFSLFRTRSTLKLLLVWGAAGGVLLGVTLFFRPIYFPGRGESILFVAAILIAATGTDRQRTRSIIAACLLAALSIIVTTRSIFLWNRSEPRVETQVADAVVTLVSAEDLVVTTGWWYLGVHHALDENAESYRWLTFPEEAEQHLGWYDDKATFQRNLVGSSTRSAIGEALTQGHEVWILRTPALPSNRTLDPLVQQLNLVPRAGQPPLWELWGPRPVMPPAKQR